MKALNLDVEHCRDVTLAPDEDLDVHQNGKVRTWRIAWQPPLPEDAIVVAARGGHGHPTLCPLRPTQPGSFVMENLAALHAPDVMEGRPRER